jgi:murein DD-endopeptidase MepM/ murein hydrolase activator NlpD
MTTYQTHQTQESFDALALVAIVLIVFGGLMVLRDFNSKDKDLPIGGEMVANQMASESTEGQAEDLDVGSGRAAPASAFDPSVVAPPYDKYTLTQGPHGFSYGHMAIDITAGKGAVIKSPIWGYVTERYTDQYGNPTLVIENDVYQVTMLHGKYKVEVGDFVELGQMVGRESNLGNTTDMWGQSCRNRDCGYHTHLNIFDKRIGSNVNPLAVIEN